MGVAPTTHTGWCNMARNWDELGIRWSEETVTRDKDTVAGAQIAVVVDHLKFDAALRTAGSSMVNVLNASSSPRVLSQHQKRYGAGKDKRGEELREIVWAALCGARAPATQIVVERIVEKRIVTLPNGKTWDGMGGRVGYVSQGMAALVEMGVPAGAAKAAASAAADENGIV